MKEKLLYIGMKYDYGDKSRGLSFEHRNFYHSLKSYCIKQEWDFIHYDFMDRGSVLGSDLMTEELYEYAKREQPTYIFAVLFDFHRDPKLEVFKRLSGIGIKTIHWFCDDHWRYEKYSSVVAPNFDFICTTANSALPKYKKQGISNKVIKTQWACNHELYIPYDVSKDIDMSFVGQPHGDRKEVTGKIIESGIDLKIFGFNWEKFPRIPFYEMVRVFSRSKINLNLSNSSTMIGQQIKGRNFEVPGTKSFLLTSDAENLEEYYENGKEIVIFRSFDELIDKAKYYLKNTREREIIAERAYQRTLAEHTWHHRFDHIFSSVEKPVKQFKPGSISRNLKAPVTKSNPLVSIIIPCYNQGEYLPDALNSIASQTFSRLEVIIVNDGSTDNSEQVASAFIKNNKNINITLLSIENGGLANARNTGIETAKGEYILPLDADDTLKTNALERLLEYAEKFNDYDIFYPDYDTFGAVKKLVNCINEEEFLNPARSENGLPYCSLYKKEVWVKNGGYNTNMIWGFEDWDFWISSLSNGFRAKKIAEPLFNYRVKSESMLTSALKYNDHLRAQIVLNHSSLYTQAMLSEVQAFINKHPVVSVIVPTYNRPDTLKNALESILKQDFHLFEIIVVNDAGQDVSDIVKEFNDSRIKYVANSINKGLPASRNVGIKAAKGKYIALLDDDDIFYPDHLSTGLKYLNDKNRIIYTDAVRSTISKVNGIEKEVGKTVPYSIDYDRNKLLIGNIAPVNCFIFEKALAEKAGLFDESLPVLEDWEFWLRLSDLTDFKHVKKNTVQVNWFNDGSTMTSSKQEDFAKTRKLIYKRYENEINAISNMNEIVEEFNAIWRKDNQQEHPLVSVIALTFNQLDYTKAFVESVLKFTNVPFELILIDNNSTDETPAYLNELSKTNKNVIAILNTENTGFPKGINQGIKVSSGKYILVANNDILVTQNWIYRMLQIAESDPAVGLVGPISNSVSGVQIDRNANYSSVEEMFSYAEKVRKENTGKMFVFPRVAFLCTLIKKEVIEKIGGLDERFSPGNFEDDDFCLRAQLAGYKAVVAQDVFIHHFGSKSFTAEGLEKYQERLDKNKQIFIDKWSADPEEIWLQGKKVNQRSIMYPLNSNQIVEMIERAKIQLNDQEYRLALDSLYTALAVFDEQSAQELNLNNWDLLTLTGNVALLANELDAASECFESALNMNPQSAPACTGLGEVFYKKEMFEPAKTMFEWGVFYDLQNQKAASMLREVNALLGLNPEDNSIDNQSKKNVQQQKKNDSNATQLLAQAADLLLNKKYSEAKAYIESAEGLFNGQLSNPADPEFASSFYNLKGYIYLSLNEVEKAKELFEKSLSLNPRSSQACTGLGEILFIEGLQNAKAMFEWGVKNNRSNILAIEGLKKVNNLLNLSDNDISENLSSQSEGSLVELLDMAYKCFEKQEYDKALEVLAAAEELLPENDMKIRSAVESLKGFSYLGLDNLESAKGFFERALNDEPDSSDACAGLGEVFRLTCLDKEAKTMFEWALLYNPGNKFALTGLTRVNELLGLEKHHNSLIQEYH